MFYHIRACFLSGNQMFGTYFVLGTNANCHFKQCIHQNFCNSVKIWNINHCAVFDQPTSKYKCKLDPAPINQTYITV